VNGTPDAAGGWLVYVYGVVGTEACQATDGLRGLEGAAVRSVDAEGLAAAVSDVPADAFGEEALNDRIRDMAWLGPRAVAHQAVNERLHERTPGLIPLNFGTVFRDDERVRAMLRDQAPVLRERLQAVRGRSEWVVALHRTSNLTVDHLRERSPKLQTLEAEIAAAPPGRAHLMRRRLVEARQEEARRLDSAAAREVLQALQAVADGVYAEPLPSPAEAADRPLVRASVLVRRDAEQQFMEAVEELERQWGEPEFRFTLTGPWPPYRFGGLGADEPRARVVR
jgi:Gas vesicle synthesis protein GvpL/GvpF